MLATSTIVIVCGDLVDKTPYNSIMHATLFQSCDKITQTAGHACAPPPPRAALEQSSSVEFVPCFIKRVNRYKDWII